MSSSPADPVPSAQLHPAPYVVEPLSDPPIPSLFPGPMLLVMAVSFLVITPFFFWGNPSGHDFEFHMFSWMEVVSQWKQGILYPRWASLSHWGYGEARFVFYPPLSWNLGAILGAFLPWRVAPGAYIWTALSGAGCSMFLLVRRWMPRHEAMFAAALYAANPYHLVIVYWRSALAELLASCLLPLLLLCVLSLADGRRRSIIPLSLIIAAAWLTNGPSAVMVNYSVALLALVIALVKKQPRILAMAGVAVVIGGLLPSFYLLPAAYEQHWVNLREVFAPGVRPQDNFLFTTLPDVDHNHFNWLVSTVAVAEIAVVLGTLSVTARFRRAQRAVWWMLAGWAAVATLLMLPFTTVFWDHLPKLRFVQLPWRWLLCLNVAFAIFVTAACRRWWQRAAICAAMLITIGILWNRVQPPWWDTAADIDEMHDAIEDGLGYEGTDEYVPAGVDPSDVNKDAPNVSLQGGGRNARVDIDAWHAQNERFHVIANDALRARLRLFNYPAWQVVVDGAPVQAETAENTGEILVPLPAGKHQVDVTFVRTWDRKVGVLVSALALLLLLAVWLTERGRALDDLRTPRT
jgi:6-pyruvoyl-tetrahydropterin synthase related domain